MLASVHPHVRGDDIYFSRFVRRLAGSPPRAWGRRARGHSQRPRHRFTPTCVGTTEAQQQWLQPRTVHPHVRGDDIR